MATPLSDFYSVLRAIAGDDGPDVFFFPSTKLDEVIKLAVNLGKVEGFTISSGQISPALDPSNTTAYGQLVMAAAKFLVTPMTRHTISTRAVSAAFGDPHSLIHNVLAEAYRIESGEELGA